MWARDDIEAWAGANGVVRDPGDGATDDRRTRVTLAVMGSDGFMLHADSGERLRFSDAEFVVKASADTTGGAFTIIEEIEPLDTPFHVHANEDELFYILEGEHVIQCGQDEFHVGPGGMVFAPRGVPHTHRRVVPRTGRFLTITTPAGFEGFFRELAEAERAGSPMLEAYARVSEKYGVTWPDR